MTTPSILEVFAVNEKVGVLDPSTLSQNIPLFLPKATWQFYTYSVLRNGIYTNVKIEELVQGDIITLKKGDVVPATIRLLRASSLTVLEDHISGTVSPSHKQTFASKSLAPKSQQKNMLFSGSEILEGTCKGIIVRCAQYDTYVNKYVRPSRTLQKKGIISQTKNAVRSLKLVTTIFFDDLQQETEILRLIRHVYQRNNISTIFFVSETVKNRLQKVLPPEVFNGADLQGIRIYANIQESNKAKLLAQANTTFDNTMFVHRGTEHTLLPKIATLNMVISPHASQVAIRNADLIAEQISVTKFTSILYNKK